VVVGGGSSNDGGSSAVALPTSPTALPTVTNDQFKGMLADLQGKVVVVNIWASWCGPCTAEAPGLAHLAKHYGDRVQFLGVDIEDQTTPARAFIQKYGWTYPSVADPKGEIKRGYGFLGQPDTLVYNVAGTHVWTGAGVVDTSDLQSEIDKALASASAS
jgi:cytochrome c biogenesis protein CcmG/thiol:disulfide interchange protein DsbE